MVDSSDDASEGVPDDQVVAGVPTFGPLLGLDYGTRRVGVAICPPEQNFATPVETIHRTTIDGGAERLRFLAADYRVVGLVVGLPVHMSGNEGGKAREARRFGEWAGRVTGLPVAYWDERFTSAAADELLAATGLKSKQRRGRLDAIAAQQILQSFLDSPNRQAAPQPIDR